MNSSQVSILGPFISQLQILVYPLLMLKMQLDDQLGSTIKIMHKVSSADIVPDFILEPLQEFFFGEFEESE